MHEVRGGGGPHRPQAMEEPEDEEDEGLVGGEDGDGGVRESFARRAMVLTGDRRLCPRADRVE